MERTIKHDLSSSPQDKLFIIILLIKVDTTAAPTLYVVDQLYPWTVFAYLFEIYLIHIEHFHIFHATGEIKTGNARVNAMIQVDLPRFDQTLSKLPEKI